MSSACSLLNLVRRDIRVMKPYVSARSLSPLAEGDILLDANEMPYAPLVGTKGYNCYADQQPVELIEAVASFFKVDPVRLLVSRGADEAIDLLVRLFCQPGKDSILISPPAFPMYARAAELNGTRVISVPLEIDFTLDVDSVCAAAAEDTKLVFVTTPHNPVGISIPEEDIIKLCEHFKGRAAIVVDEAYIDFSPHSSAAHLIDSHDNVVVLRTLSKSMGLAGVRCGGVIMHQDLIKEALKVLAVYPVPVPVLETVLEALSPASCKRMREKRARLLVNKKWFVERIENLDVVEKVFPSDANFILVRFKDVVSIESLARKNGFVLRDQNNVPSLEGCIRISIGTRSHMEALATLFEKGELPERMKGRKGECLRRTKETGIDVKVNLDRVEPISVSTGIGFFDHMLDQIATHAGISLKIEAQGDTHIDLHHSVEDTAIALGQALAQALGDKRGIERYGFTLPMDESLAQIALDLGGRGMFVFKGSFAAAQVGELPTILVEHFFRSLAENLQATIHLSIEGADTHHQVEACFKAFGRALRMAVEQNKKDMCVSTKRLL